jgi:polysaccharide pyruvyl transferase WcaK-like protein
MKKKVLLIGIYSLLNKGDMAIFNVLTKILKSINPKLEFTAVFPFPQIERKYCRDVKVAQPIIMYPAKCVSLLLRAFLHHIFLTYLGRTVELLVRDKFLAIYRDADIIVDLSGDALSKRYGIFNTLYHLHLLLLGVFLNKKIAIISQSIGPFGLSRFLYKFVFGKASLITIRDKISLKYLRRIGVKNSYVYQTADLSFLLQSTNPKHKKLNYEKRPIVGVTISKAGTFEHEKFICMISSVLDKIIEELDAKIVFIPHSFGPKRRLDDRFVHKEIFWKLKHKKRCLLIEKEYSPEELKSVIKECDMYISTRLHPIISAVSSYVPAIGVESDHKIRGTLVLLDLDTLVINTKNIKPEEFLTQLKQKIEHVWKNKKRIRKKLRRKMKFIRKMSFLNIKLLIKLMKQN